MRKHDVRVHDVFLPLDLFAQYENSLIYIHTTNARPVCVFIVSYIVTSVLAQPGSSYSILECQGLLPNCTSLCAGLGKQPRSSRKLFAGLKISARQKLLFRAE